MSLDIYLTVPREKSRAEQAIDLLRENGFGDFADELYARHSDDCGPWRAFDLSLTHNLTAMAKRGGFYTPVWHPEEMGITKAPQMIEHLQRAITWLESNREEAKRFEVKDERGTYEYILAWLGAYKVACNVFPDADIEVSR